MSSFLSMLFSQKHVSLLRKLMSFMAACWFFYYSPLNECTCMHKICYLKISLKAISDSITSQMRILAIILKLYLFDTACIMIHWVCDIGQTHLPQWEHKMRKVVYDVTRRQTEWQSGQVAQYLKLSTLYCLAMFCLWFSSTCLNLVSRPRSWTSIFSTYCRSLWVRWSSTWMDWVIFCTWNDRLSRWTE